MTRVSSFGQYCIVYLGAHSQRVSAERLLYFLADRQASDYFTALGYEPHKEEFVCQGISSSAHCDRDLLCVGV